MEVIIKNSSDVPIYIQIKEQVKEAILKGEMSEGDALPSIRQLARDLKISVITTTRAYTELEQEGYIFNVQGKGCFVAPKDSNLVKEQLLRKIEDNFTEAVNTAKIAKMTRKELLGVLEFILKGQDYE